MNNFILIYSKQELEIDTLTSDKEIDLWYKQDDNHNILSMQTLKETRLAKDSLLVGVEVDNCLTDHKDSDKILFVCGDPYKMESESLENILDIISAQSPKKIYDKVGGAYSWINYDFKQKSIEIHTDFFTQLPIYYFNDNHVFAASSSIKLLLETLPVISRKVDINEIIKFIISGDVYDYHKPFFQDIHKLKGHQRIRYNGQSDQLDISYISSLDDFRNIDNQFSPKGLKNDLENVMKAAAPENTAYMLSGGVDSTLLAAVGTSVSKKLPTICYTASTGYGNDLLFSRKAAEYMKSVLHEVKLNYDADLLKYIEELTAEYGMPVPIWGNTVGTSLIADNVKRDEYHILISGGAEDFVAGGVYPRTIINYAYYYTNKKMWKKLFSLLKFNYSRGIISTRKVLQEIFRVLFVCKDKDVVIEYQFKGKDSSGFFSKEIQDIRNKLLKQESCCTNLENRIKNHILGGIQKYIFQPYMAGVLSGIQIRLPFLDSRLIKYMDLNDEILFSEGLSKQFARDAMKGLMDYTVINRADNEGLRWRSTTLLKKNKKQIIDEIRNSDFLKEILSNKTLENLEKRTFRKSLLLSLYSIALFDKTFKITLE